MNNEEKNLEETADISASPAATPGKPPLSMDQKKKVWTRRIIGAIVFCSIMGCIMLIVAAQAVTYMFKTILTP